MILQHSPQKLSKQQPFHIEAHKTMNQPHPEPLSIDVKLFVESLDSNAREYFEERAGIAEFEAGMSRADAEQFAMELTRAHFKLADI
jgi:hypothetical protein